MTHLVRLAMNARQERGMQIAAMKQIRRISPFAWLCPSQNSDKKYHVFVDHDNKHCSCPDHLELGVKCKHIFAVEIVIQRELFPDGTQTVTQTVVVAEKVKKTYAQDWPAYNAAQTHEKEKFLSLLHDLCSRIETPAQKTGRPRASLADSIFAACFKVYSTFSGRRFMTDLRDAQAKGYVKDAIHYNSIFRTLENPELFPVLKALITESSLPLKAVESDFAVDSSGFSVSRFVRWIDEKYGKEHSGRDWVKAHICCGVKTNVITAVEIHDRHAADGPLFRPLVDATAKNFTIGEVSADKGYSSRENFDVADSHGGTAFITFKSQSTGGAGGLYAKMFHYFNYRQEEFLAHYHKRSNVESTFSMLKAKFRDHVRSKSDAAMKNEVLCKILCHNICCLIQEMYELGIEPEFWADKPADILPMKQSG
jgi:transposase